MDKRLVSPPEREILLDMASDMLMSDENLKFGKNVADYLPQIHDLACEYHKLSPIGKEFLKDFLKKALKESGKESPEEDFLYWGGRCFVLPQLPEKSVDKKWHAQKLASAVLDRIGTEMDPSPEDVADCLIEAALLDNITLAYRCDFLDSMVADQEGVPVDSRNGLYTYLPSGEVVSLSCVFANDYVDEVIE